MKKEKIIKHEESVKHKHNSDKDNSIIKLRYHEMLDDWLE